MAVKAAVVAPAGTITVAGKAITSVLLVSLTTKPPLGAAALSVMVQVSVPNPVIAPLAHVSPETDGVGAVAVMPDPVNWTTFAGCVAASLLMVTCPDAIPAAVGLKCTCRL
jgi:hypothetical protein